MVPLRLTETLVRRAHGSKLASFPTSIVETSKQLILDGIAVSVAGAQEAPIVRYLKYATGSAAKLQGEHTVIQSSHRLPPMNAATVNGMMMHVLDYEPMWHPPTHAVSPLLPSLLAACQLGESEVSGSDLLRAFAASIEFQGRLRVGNEKGANIGTFVQHPPGFVGCVSSALGAGMLLGLSEPQLRCAVGIATSRMSGLMGNVGTDTKCAHCGLAAGNGLEAALLAREGFTANQDMLEHPRGFLQAVYPDGYDLEIAAKDFLTEDADAWRMQKPGFAVKYFPAHYSQQFVITNALELGAMLRAAGKSAADIESITIRTPRYDYVNRPSPATGIEGKFSMQFNAVAALLDGDVGLTTYTNASVQRPEVQALLSKVQLQVEEDRKNHLVNMELNIDVRAVDGTVYKSTNPWPRGHWNCTVPKLALVQEKAQKCFDYAGVSAPRGSHIIDSIVELEKLTSPELKTVVNLLGAQDANEDAASAPQSMFESGFHNVETSQTPTRQVEAV